jgi:hypothetical protein
MEPLSHDERQYRNGPAALSLLLTAFCLGCGGTNQSLPPPVSEAVDIVAQPVSITIPLGLTGTFTITVTGTPPLSYQWSENGSTIPGATGASYSTPSIQTSDNNASYTVTVSNSVNSVTSNVATVTVSARAPEAGDLRFQQVDSSALAVQTPELSTVLGPGEIATFPDSLGTPLQIGYGGCYPGIALDCAWPIEINNVPAKATTSTLLYVGGEYGDFESDLASMNTPNAVMTSLDFQPGDNAYGAEWYQTTGAGGFDLIERVVAPSDIASVVAQDGANSRVITAVSFDASGQAHRFSYGWQGDSTTAFDTNIMTVTGDEVASAAVELSGHGYVITAFGGDLTNGFVLIGAKVHGDSLPRNLYIFAEDPALAVNGPRGSGIFYAPVGRLNLPTDGTAYGSLIISEQ